MSLISIFPTLDALVAAPLRDVAAVVLRAAQHQARPTFNARNLMSGLADAYTTGANTNEPPHVRRDRARHIVAEARGYLFSQNFLATVVDRILPSRTRDDRSAQRFPQSFAAPTCAGENESIQDRIFFVLVVRSADLQEQRSGTRRTSVAEEHLNVVLRVHRIETAAPPIGDTERGARDTFVIARVAA
jgi:hypothetical protein